MNNRIIYLENTVNQLLSYIAGNNIQQQTYSSNANYQLLTNQNTTFNKNNQTNPMNTNNTNTAKRYDTKLIKKENEDVLDDSLMMDFNDNNQLKINNFMKSNKTISINNNESNYTTKRSSRLVDIYAELNVNYFLIIFI
jgi:hypothetical protein